MSKKYIWLGMIFIAVLFFSGCAASGMKDVETTGFLDDYSQLKPGGDDRAALVYVDPNVDFKAYDKLMFERVRVVFARNAQYRYAEFDPAILKELTDYYQNALLEAVRDGYQIVEQPGPGVMRVRVAITELRASKPAANTVSTILPVGWAIAGATKAVSDENLGTGEAGTEFELVDAMSGGRLAAAVDKRQGGKGVFRGKWDDTKDAFDLWAKRFRMRLDEARGM